MENVSTVTPNICFVFDLLQFSILFSFLSDFYSWCINKRPKFITTLSLCSRITLHFLIYGRNATNLNELDSPLYRLVIGVGTL